MLWSINPAVPNNAYVLRGSFKAYKTTSVITYEFALYVFRWPTFDHVIAILESQKCLHVNLNLTLDVEGK